jgi:hypothetical protein
MMLAKLLEQHHHQQACTRPVAGENVERLIQHVREKFTCRDCEKISPAPGTFQDFGMTSSVSVMSSPNLHSRPPRSKGKP